MPSSTQKLRPLPRTITCVTLTNMPSPNNFSLTAIIMVIYKNNNTYLFTICFSKTTKRMIILVLPICNSVNIIKLNLLMRTNSAV